MGLVCKAGPALVSLALSLVCLCGCTTTVQQSASVNGLTEHLQKLSGRVLSTEAALASQVAHSYSLQLAEDYKVVGPAHFHNMLVNLGLRQKGLCFHWADDLFIKLNSLNLSSLQLHRGIARADTRREHNCVVVTAFDQAFEQGIVLDAWRHSGRLYWGEVQKDKYPWRELQESLPQLGAHPPATQPAAAVIEPDYERRPAGPG